MYNIIITESFLEKFFVFNNKTNDDTVMSNILCTKEFKYRLIRQNVGFFPKYNDFNSWLADFKDYGCIAMKIGSFL